MDRFNDLTSEFRQAYGDSELVPFPVLLSNDISHNSFTAIQLFSDTIGHKPESAAGYSTEPIMFEDVMEAVALIVLPIRQVFISTVDPILRTAALST